MMQPCCLSTEKVEDRQCCAEHADLTGGKTGFTVGRCPDSPSEAAAMLADTEDSPDVGASADSGESTDAGDILKVMDRIKEAEKAAEKEAAEKAKEASEDLKKLAESRQEEVAAEE